MKFDWIFEKQNDLEQIKSFAENLKVPLQIANILINKGIDNRDKAVKFFSPSLKYLHDPFLMKDMDKAVNRLEKAIKNNEKILIYGDYDTDGTTAVAFMYLFLKNFYPNVDFYIPDRYSEGYGISLRGIDYASENGFSLIIALDCGIKAIEQINYANQKNIDFIICDHHTPGETLPNAVAVLDPKRKDCKYPFKELTGCGVGFKLAQAYAEKNNIDKQIVFENLHLVAISTAADIVPIIGENRILTYFGLQKINKTKRPGINAILEYSGLKEKEKISVSDCVFRISPRINAAGRLTHAKNSVKLLITDNHLEANELANALNILNKERQNLDRTITKEIFEIFEQKPYLKEKKSTVLFNPGWHKGVIGIVASKVIEKYYKPTIILTESEGKITGSGRSVEGFDLYEAINKCSHLLSGFGGHKYAAGLTLKENALDDFIICFENAVNELITEEQTIPKIRIAETIQFSDITERFVKILSYFAPFGPANLKPVFFTSNVRDTGETMLIGENKDHIKFSLVDISGKKIQGFGFNMAKYYPQIQNKTFDIIYTIVPEDNSGKNFWIDVKDLKIRY